MDKLFFSINYDESDGLQKLLEQAVGEENKGNINWDFKLSRFPSVRRVKLGVEAYQKGERHLDAAFRMNKEGLVSANIAELAAFVRERPDFVEKWDRVFVVDRDSWCQYGKDIFVPYAWVKGTERGFGHCNIQDALDTGPGSNYGLLVKEI